jgi:hypothetical protein
MEPPLHAVKIQPFPWRPVSIPAWRMRAHRQTALEVDDNKGIILSAGAAGDSATDRY